MGVWKSEGRQSLVENEKILAELAAIGFARASDYMTVQDGAVTYRDWEQLSEREKAAVAGVEKGSSGLKIKLYDKMKALELLGKALGLFDGDAVRSQDSNLLEAIVAATDKEVDTHDIPEIQQAAAHRPDLVESPQVEAS